MPPANRMKSKDWKKKTVSQMKLVGTYQKAFDPAIDAASLILEARDKAYQEFLDSGGEAVVEHISDRGSVNMKKNPRLEAWMALDKQALEHWKGLGLTVDTLKKINDSAVARQKDSALVEVLKGMT